MATTCTTVCDICHTEIPGLENSLDMRANFSEDLPRTRLDLCNGCYMIVHEKVRELL